MSGYGYNQGYNQPTGGWQQNQQCHPTQQHPTQGGHYGQQQQSGQYGQPAPQNYGNAPGGGYQAQSSYSQPPHNGQQNYSQPQNQYNNSQPGPGGPASGQTGDRGMMGALGGGVAGGLLGKKNNHGFLGTVGGAIVGSLLEDATKKKKHGHHH
ncbi:hypothetical protein PGTUg99_030570 [Puccinia graminis f. sp. tritici]|uniref:Glycine zipper 2TM domain-containing protein n=2 Tax=Puccinia graminis f. sp. tritici TaxID=56615 RepID=E3L357_PUCGT|nr:uncharacterized protein PGTG_17254 [Puccinia graminis f. sp. tritici CRL 75-36-700-3]EFP90982.1 hypothetical protein PGTG_17254 [Puccinia graminis f. sp. tritici CRL 75-36-700-3]KAA1088273.1 hypothetical protein PGTUg99_030570 [Puccinia graminis f. sp. tritici]